MGRKIRFWTAAATGAMLQYLCDPQAGQVRRALLREQLADRILAATAALKGKATSNKPGSLRLVPMFSYGRFSMPREKRLRQEHIS